MKKTMQKTISTILVVLMGLTLAPLQGFVDFDWNLLDFCVKASVATEGYYTYTVSNDKATITDVDTSISGDITIPSTLGGYPVTSIGDYAFHGCSALTSVTIPDSVTSIGECAFEGCETLTSIIVDENNSNYSSDANGVLFNKNRTTLIQYPAGSNKTAYTIPDSVTSIGNYAFVYCDALTSVTIPDSVTSIGNFAFAYCSALTSVSIPDSVTSIGICAFADCSALTSVSIPDSVTSIGECAFAGCETLTSIIVDENNSNYSSDANGVLFNKNRTTLIQYPAGSNKTAYTIPDSVTSIGYSAFEDCSALTSVTIGNSVTSIGEYAFEDCSALTSVSIPDSVTSIGYSAFEDCSALTSVTIPDSVTSISWYAFNRCYKLTDVYYMGTEEQWKKISISLGNEDLTGATIHFSQDTELGDANSDGYKLRLRSDGAYSDSIAVGETISFWTFLYEGKNRLDCKRAYAISFDTPGIFEVVKTNKTSTSFDVTLKAQKAGMTNMTVSDSETGAYVTISLKTNNPIEVTTMDEVKNLAKEYQKGRLTHFYDYNGLYVDGYSYRKNKDGSYNVSMNVYNEKAHHGAVVSYDKDGNIVDYELIDPQDKLPTSLWDGLFDSFDLVNAQLEKLTDKYLYDETALTKKTRIDDLNVPDGGYFVISNNYLENEYVFFANSINVAIDLICAYSKVNKIDVPDELPEKATEKVLEKIFKDLGPDQIKTVFKKLVKNFAKDLTISNVDVFMSGLVSTFDEFEINIEEIIKDTLEDLMTDTEAHLDFAEDIVLTLFGADAIKTALSSLGYINTGIKLIDVFSSSLAPEIVVYTPAEKDTVRISNGVTVTSETPLASDYVLHTYVINEQDDVMTQAKPTIESMTSNYKMYDITLYKSSQATQPNSKITVMIPIPANYNKSKIQIYWYKDDGTLQPMNATVKGDYAVFETDHLSYYVLIETHNHEYEIISTVDADCAKKGSITYSCNCGNTYTEEISIDKNAHSWDNGTITTTATCNVSGVKTYTCQHNASHKKTEKLGINASNHVNTKNVPETPATFKNVGYTAGVYCNDCKKYLSGHVEIPKLVPEFTDSKDAKESGNNIVSNNGLTVAQLLSQAGKGATIKTKDGKAVENAVLIGTGMVLTMADGSKKEIVVYGDVDGDGKISAADARLALRASVGLEKYKETSAQYRAANVESKDKMSASDARLILRAAVGLEDPKSWLK